MIYDKIKTAQVVARKAKDKIKATCLTTLMGELQNKSTTNSDGTKVVSDELVLSTLKKFIKDINTILENKEDDNLVVEKNILSEILTENSPKQMTEDELVIVIEDIIDGGANNMGQIMGGLKKAHNGKYDGAMASRLVKSILK
jgi:uncharacterized protein YqeY